MTRHIYKCERTMPVRARKPREPNGVNPPAAEPQKRPVVVILGYDRPLREFHLQLHYEHLRPQEKNPFFTSDGLSALKFDKQDLNSFRKMLSQRGISIPERIFMRVQNDADENLGNCEIEHFADGTMNVLGPQERALDKPRPTYLIAMMWRWLRSAGDEGDTPAERVKHFIERRWTRRELHCFREDVKGFPWPQTHPHLRFWRTTLHIAECVLDGKEAALIAHYGEESAKAILASLEEPEVRLAPEYCQRLSYDPKHLGVESLCEGINALLEGRELEQTWLLLASGLRQGELPVVRGRLTVSFAKKPLIGVWAFTTHRDPATSFPQPLLSIQRKQEPLEALAALEQRLAAFRGAASDQIFRLLEVPCAIDRGEWAQITPQGLRTVDTESIEQLLRAERSLDELSARQLMHVVSLSNGSLLLGGERYASLQEE